MSSIPVISQIVQTKTRKWKVYWYLIFFVGIGGCSYQVLRFLQAFYAYPVSIDLQVESNFQQKFPAVTFCNLNNLKNSHKKYCIPKDWYQCIRDRYKKRTRWPTYPPKVVSPRYAYRPTYENGMFAYKKVPLIDFGEIYRSAANNILNAYLKLDALSRKCYGHQFHEMVQGCSFQSKQCQPNDFVYYQSLQYGNCYTFKGQQQRGGDTSKTGPGSGLELDLNIYEGDYLDITKVVGVRLVIHNQDENPDPEGNGINISPGYETHVTVNKVSHKRLPEPYRDGCKSYFAESYNRSEKSVDECIRQCLHQHSMSSCFCVDPFLPSVGMLPCDLENTTQISCLDEVFKLLNEGSLECDCPPPCFSTTHKLQTSYSLLKTNLIQSKIPFEAYLDVECSYRHIKDEDVAFYGDEKNASLAKEFAATFFDSHSFLFRRETNMKLKVYYGTPDHKIYAEKATYADSELLAHLGGNLSLWLGFSVVSLVEIAENMFVLICVMFTNKKKMLSLTKTLT